jgi:hypothetical protein
MFTLTGTTRIPTGRRRQATLTWSAGESLFGEFSGDSALVIEAERRADEGETVRATPSGPSVEAARLPQRTAAILAASLFETFGWEGDFPDSLLDYEGVA